jgi:uncharacterized membrane protein
MHKHSPYSRWTFLFYNYAKINFASNLLNLVILEIYPIYINYFMTVVKIQALAVVIVLHYKIQPQH